MGRLAKQIMSDLATMERGEAYVTESPIGDRGEPRAPAGQPNGRILLRLSRSEHATLVREAAEQGVDWCQECQALRLIHRSQCFQRNGVFQNQMPDMGTP